MLTQDGQMFILCAMSAVTYLLSVSESLQLYDTAWSGGGLDTDDVEQVQRRLGRVHAVPGARHATKTHHLQRSDQ